MFSNLKDEGNTTEQRFLKSLEDVKMQASKLQGSRTCVRRLLERREIKVVVGLEFTPSGNLICCAMVLHSKSMELMRQDAH